MNYIRGWLWRQDYLVVFCCCCLLVLKENQTRNNGVSIETEGVVAERYPACPNCRVGLREGLAVGVGRGASGLGILGA